jgi:hypothetical protein
MPLESQERRRRCRTREVRPRARRVASEPLSLPVSERISELRGEKVALEEALSEIGAEREEAEVDELSKQLTRVPDLAKALREAPPELQRQVFQAFELQIL